MLPVLLGSVFLVTLGLAVSALFFLVETPLARRQMRTRLVSAQPVVLERDAEADLLKKDVYSDVPFLNRVLTITPGITRVRALLDQAGMKVELGTFVLIAAALPLLVLMTGMLLDSPPIYSLLAGAACAALPFAYASLRQHRRLAKFQEQFPEAIDLLARSIRAGHAFTSGLEMAGREFPDPLGEEFRTVYRQQNLGLPLREALGNMILRMPSPDLRILISALQIQRDAGGNLGEILDSLATVIRERFKLRRQVVIFTAEGRLSTYMLSGLPIATAVGLSIFNPGYLSPLVTDPRGHVAIAVAIILQVIGYVVLSRITKIKI